MIKPTTDKLRSPSASHKSSMVCKPTRAIANRPTHLTLTTIPRDTPDAASQKNHSIENGLKTLLDFVHDRLLESLIVSKDAQRIRSQGSKKQEHGIQQDESTYNTICDIY